MDIVTILRDLWRLRRYVIVVCVLAVLAGLVVVYKLPGFESRSYDVGVASARVLVDTPSSQVVNVAPRGSDTTAARADLLATLMVDGVVKSTIAHNVGLEPSRLTGVTQAATDPSAAGPAPVSVPRGRDAYVLSTQILTNSAGEELPIIALDTQAPTQAKAAQLATSAMNGLRDYLNSKAALQRVPDADRIQVNGLGAPQASTVTRGPSNAIAIAVVILVLAIGCASILGTRALVRGWRAASARERIRGGDGPSTGDLPLASEQLLLAGDDLLVANETLAPDPQYDQTPTASAFSRPQAPKTPAFSRPQKPKASGRPKTPNAPASGQPQTPKAPASSRPSVVVHPPSDAWRPVVPPPEDVGRPSKRQEPQARSANRR